jgi:predicted porin
MVIDKCSVAWTEAGTSPAFTYTCGGTTTSVLASRAVIGTNLTLSNLTLTAGAGNHLRVTLTLPSGTSNSTQGLSSTVTYAFTGTQRAATNK